MSLTFHATPPRGAWINDPNGLVFADGAYRLFVQHRADAPEFRATGWARLSSPDLLRWTWDGAVLPPAGGDWMYSGSVRTVAGGMEAVLTLHDASGAGQRQGRFASGDAGATWAARPVEMPAVATGPNARDPFVIAVAAEVDLPARQEMGARLRGGDGPPFHMLLARPCGWSTWEDDPPSRLAVLASEDGVAWREAGTIGPWSPPGVLWEVPVLARLNGHDVLFVSLVDRRGGGAACAVRAWVGVFDGAGFAVDGRWPAEGRAVDLGPDFYALMVSAAGGWPGEPAFVAWLSSWATARTMPWPGFAGGPISLPRRLRVVEDTGGLRLAHGPAAGLAERFGVAVAEVPEAGLATMRFDGTRAFLLSIASSEGTIEVSGHPDEGWTQVSRAGVADWLLFRPEAVAGAIAPCPERTLLLFVDGAVVEVFVEPDRVAMSAGLPTGVGTFGVECRVDGEGVAVEWRVMHPRAPRHPSAVAGATTGGSSA